VNALRFSNLWLFIGLLLVMLVTVASLVPYIPYVPYFRGVDKLGHFAAYVAITFWFGLICGRNRVRWTIAMGFILMGMCLEYLQRMSGYRTFEYTDMGANAAGVLCALLLVQTRLSRGLAVVEKSLLRSFNRLGLGRTHLVPHATSQASTDQDLLHCNEVNMEDYGTMKKASYLSLLFISAGVIASFTLILKTLMFFGCFRCPAYCSVVSAK
jgi:hypothetical protein